MTTTHLFFSSFTVAPLPATLAPEHGLLFTRLYLLNISTLPSFFFSSFLHLLFYFFPPFSTCQVLKTQNNRHGVGRGEKFRKYLKTVLSILIVSLLVSGGQGEFRSPYQINIANETFFFFLQQDLENFKRRV